MPPKTAKSYVTEAQQLEKTGDILGAIQLYKRFLSRHRDHPNALKARSRTALLCLMVGKYDDAIAIVENAGAAGHSQLHMMYTLAQACAYAGYLDKAHDALDKTLAIEPNHPPAIARLATVLQYEDRKDEALALVDDANRRGVDSWDLDHTLGELAPKAGRVDEAVDRIEKRLSDPTIKDAPRIELEYMLSTLLEKQQNYKGAWEAAKRGNELKTDGGFGRHVIKGAVKNKINTGIEDYVTRINTIMDIFNPEMLKSLEPNDSGPNPLPQMLMISGMPRSGTTLLEQILSAHPQAESAGEAPFLIKAAADLKLFPKPSREYISRLSTKKRSKIGAQILQDLYLRSGGNQFVVDKHPGNDEHIGFLSAVAPGAKMILTRRDPRDIALSCFFRNFAHGHGWSNKFESIVNMIEVRLQMHEHWLELIPQAAPWIEIRVGDYEKIVRDPETQTREIVEFAGLPWDDACLNFSKRKRIVPTLQPNQAAQGIYTGSLAKWVPFNECMGDQLERLNAICERFGYPV